MTLPFVSLCALGSKVRVLSSRWYPDDTGELVEKSAKSCKIRWPDGGLGIYDYEGNDFFVITPK